MGRMRVKNPQLKVERIKNSFPLPILWVDGLEVGVMTLESSHPFLAISGFEAEICGVDAEAIAAPGEASLIVIGGCAVEMRDSSFSVVGSTVLVADVTFDGVSAGDADGGCLSVDCQSGDTIILHTVQHKR